MKRIKKSALCALLLVAQFQNCIADAQGDDQKSQCIIERVESADADATVQAEPYISKSAMLKIAAGMFVIAVGWRYLADYYGIFPYNHVLEGEYDQSSTESTTRQPQEDAALQDGAACDEQDACSWDQAIKQALYDFFSSGAPEVDGEQEEDWGAKDEREAKVDAAYRAAYQEAKDKIKEAATRQTKSKVMAELKSKSIYNSAEAENNDSGTLSPVAQKFVNDMAESRKKSSSQSKSQSLAEFLEAKKSAATQNQPENENQSLPQEVELQHENIYPEAAQDAVNSSQEQPVVTTDLVPTASAHDDQAERAAVALVQAAQARKESDNLLERAAVVRKQNAQRQQEFELREQKMNESLKQMLEVYSMKK